MSKLRPGWKRVRFGDVVDNSTAATNDYQADGFSRYIIGKHIPQDGRISEWNPVGDGEFGSRIRTIVRTGDVIITTRGPKLRVAVASFDCLSAHTNFILRAKDKRVILQDIVEAIARSAGFKDHLQRNFRGSTNLFVNWSDAAKYAFALPPLEEQRRLCRVLTPANCVANACIESMASLERARDASVAESMQRGLRGAPLATTSLGPRPEHWHTCAVGDRYDVQLGKMISEKTRGAGIRRPYLRNANIDWGSLCLDDVHEMSLGEDEITRYELRPGDIVACEGRHVGKSAIWRGEIEGACYQKALHRLRARSEHDIPEFMLHILRYYSVSGRLIRHTTGTTIPHLPLGTLRAIHVAFPPREEQEEIVAFIKQFDQAERLLLHRLGEAQALIIRLMTSTESTPR